MTTLQLRDIDFAGNPINLRFVIGQTLDIAIEVKDEDGSATNITGRTYTCEIGPEGQPAEETFTVVETDMLNGLVNFTLDTSSMDEGTYKWIAWEENSRLLWQGNVEAVSPSVT